MKKLLVVMSSLCCILFQAVGADGINRSPEGLIQVENRKFGICYWSRDWKTVVSQLAKPEVVSFLGEGGLETRQGIRRDGTYRISDSAEFSLTETVKFLSDRELQLSLELKSDTGIPSAIISWQTLIPNADYRVNPPVFNGQTIAAETKKQLEFPSRTNDELILNLKNGFLKITGGFRLTVKPGLRETEVRLLFSQTWGAIRHTRLNVRMVYTPYASSTLNLKSVMNMGFRDEIPGDRKGGWTDQGADNDLRAMVPGRREFAGIPFDIVDPAANGGKSCLAMRGAARPYFRSSATVDVPNVSGRYFYLLNSLAWAPAKGTPGGKVRIAYADGSQSEHILKCDVDTGNFWNPRDLENGAVVWQNKNDSAVIGLYATQIPLDAEKAVSRVEFVSENQVWMILAATVSNRSPEKSRATAMVMRADQRWIPFPAEFQTVRGSVADLSFLADAPAGKYGFLKTEGEHFEFEKRPGVPVRFWGTNICFGAVYMEQERVRAMLDDLVSMGYNSLRLHHFDGALTAGEEKTGGLNPENLRKLDFLLAEAKKRGLYITLDLFTYRHAGNMKKFGGLTAGEYKTLCYFEETVRDALLDFTKKLFGHVNPYTGLAWKDDPAIAAVNLINEGTLPVQTGRMSGRVRPAVEAAFQKYAAKHGIAMTGENRKLHWNAFLADAGKQFFVRMKKSMREFGVRAPLSDQNFAEAALDTRSVYDYVDTHFYWSHPAYIGKQRWKLPTYTAPHSAVGAYAGGIRDVLFTRIFGQPMTITEWNFCYPNPHSFEGPFLTAAYSALQGYDGLWQFSYSHSPRVGDPLPLGAFDYNSNPGMKLAVRAGALLYLRGDVRQAGRSIAATPSGSRILGKRLGLVTKIGLLFNSDRKADLLIAAPGEKIDTRIPLLTARNEKQAVQELVEKKLIPADSIDFESGVVKSETGELLLDKAKTVFRLVARNSEALLMRGKESVSGRFMNVRNGNVFAAFYAASLDRLPLPESRRIMLLHLTDIKNEGAVFRDSSMSILEAEGGPARLLRRNTAEIELNASGTYRLFACAPNGKRLFEVPLGRKGSKPAFTADNRSEHGGILLYELIKEK